MPQSSHVNHFASTGTTKVGGAGDDDLQKPPASGTAERSNDQATTPAMPVMDTSQDGNTTVSQQGQAESQEHKAQLMPHSANAPSPKTAPSQDMAPSPALGPIEARAPAQSVAAVPGPAPVGVR